MPGVWDATISARRFTRLSTAPASVFENTYFDYFEVVGCCGVNPTSSGLLGYIVGRLSSLASGGSLIMSCTSRRKKKPRSYMGIRICIQSPVIGSLRLWFEPLDCLMASAGLYRETLPPMPAVQVLEPKLPDLLCVAASLGLRSCPREGSAKRMPHELIGTVPRRSTCSIQGGCTSVRCNNIFAPSRTRSFIVTKYSHEASGTSSHGNLLGESVITCLLRASKQTF